MKLKAMLTFLMILFVATGVASALDGDLPQAIEDDLMGEEDPIDPEDMMGDEELPEQPGFGAILAMMGIFAAAGFVLGRR